ERIEHQVSFFQKQAPDLAAIYSDAVLIDAGSRELHSSFLREKLGDTLPPENIDLFHRLLLINNFLPAPAVMVRREALDAVGPYDESLYYEDLFMWLELSYRFQFRFLPGRLVRYRILSTSMSHADTTGEAMSESTFRVLSAWMGRCGVDSERL